MEMIGLDCRPNLYVTIQRLRWSAGLYSREDLVLVAGDLEGPLELRPGSLDPASYQLNEQWLVIFRVVSRNVLIVAFVFVLHPGIEIVLVRKIVSEMIERVKARLAKNRNAEINQARA